MEYRDYPNSSNVDRIAWYPSIEDFAAADHEDGVDVLTITFTSSPRPYAYWPVSPQQWEQLRDIEAGRSIGSLVQKAIVAPARRGEYMMEKLHGLTLGSESDGAALQELDRLNADADRLGLTPTETPSEAADSVQTQPATPSKRPARRRISRPGVE